MPKGKASASALLIPSLEAPAQNPDVFNHMASDGGSYSGSRPRRQCTTVQQTFPTHSTSKGSVVASSTVGSTTSVAGRGHGRQGPSRRLTDRRLESDQRWNVKVIGGTGIGESGTQFVSHMGIVSKLHCKIWQKDFVKLPTDIIDTIFRDLELLFRCDRTANTDKEILMHMSSMHRTWCGVLKKRHYTGKSFDDAIASVPASVNPQDWQIMCAKWNFSDEQRLAHDREPNRVEIFKIGRCKELPDDNEQWVDDESRSRYERMIQLSTPSLDSESGSTPISTEEAFISVMGKDRSGRIRCGGSRETCRTWYGTGEGSSSTDYQQQIRNIENNLRMEVEELRTEAQTGLRDG
ncbi:hypothetical protein Taro_040491 [Colocasia esculenta]|uniref:Uncharacterized protein n=1 Tax=Colocasia esculenta TaxID=4460 RepID=A0A843WDD4_COLES|nr:hypothetical protein [Colocasia esculenta]